MSATSLARALGASAAQPPGVKGAAQQRGGKERSLRERAAAAARHPAGAAALTLAGAYLMTRGAAAAFQHTRRRFLRQLLVDLCAALDAIGQPYWLDFGGLLGIYRPALLEGLRRELPPKYTIKVVTPQDSPKSSWIRVYTAFGMADLFGAHDEGGDSIAVDCGHGDTMHISKELVLPTGRMEWRGCSISVPHDVEGTLVRRYGPSWRTPKYLDKGADTVEGSKPYAKVLRLLARLGIRM